MGTQAWFRDFKRFWWTRDPRRSEYFAREDWISLEEFRKTFQGSCLTDMRKRFPGARCDMVVADCESVTPIPLTEWPWVYDEVAEEFYVDVWVYPRPLLANIRCRDAKLFLLLNGHVCCRITEQTLLPLWLMFGLNVGIRAVVSDHRPHEVRIQARKEFWDDRRYELALARNVDCGTFVLNPLEQTWTAKPFFEPRVTWVPRA